MNNTDFSILLNAIINKSGISTELKQVQQIVNKYSIDIMPELKTASLRNQMKSVSKDIANDFNKTFGTNLTGNDVFKAFESQVKQTETAIKNTRKEYEKLQAISAKKIADNQATKIKESNTLLSQQRTEYQSIWNINEKIAKLNPDTSKNEITSLQEEKNIHQENYLAIQKQLSSYSDIVNNEERVNSLLDIQKQSRLNIANITAKQTDSSSLKMLKDEEEAYRINESYNQKAIANEKNLYLAKEQAYKTNLKLNDSIELIKIKADASQKSLSTYTKTLKPSYVKEYKDRINELSDAFEKVKQTGDKTDYSKAQASMQQFKQEMKDVGAETSSFTQIIKNNILAFANWYTIGNVVSSVVRDFKEAINVIKETDTLLTEISKTSGLSGNALKQLGLNAYDSASKYGNTVQEYLKGYLEMSRGTDQETAKSLAEVSIMAQSAGDMTAELANEYVIATNAAYKLNGETSKLTAILDSQNQISNRNQISLSKIAEATKIAGSQSASSGVAINEMTAAISTMGVVTQAEGERLGRSWKGILMNLQQVKGETEDGEIIDAESLSKSEKAAAALGVSLKEVRNGVLSLRDPMVVIKELSEAYTKLQEGDVRGTNLISAIGGKIYHVIQKCIIRTYLIAGNALEPCTTI